MNPPSIILGGGVHGKACWLIAYLKLIPRTRSRTVEIDANHYSASTMYAVNHIDSFEVLVRKRVAGFIERLKDSNNSIIFCIDNLWKMIFDTWDPWIKLLFK